MLDLKLIRDHPDLVRQGLGKRVGKFPLEDILALEKSRRELLLGVENDRHTLKEASEAFGRQKAQGGGGPPPKLKELSASIKERERQLAQIEEQIAQTLAYLPNLPHASVPVGDASKNHVIRTVGKKPELTCTPKPHHELAEPLGLIDLGRASKITGSHFPLFKGAGARLERALINWMLDVHTREHGYVEVWPPLLVNRASMTGTGQLPKFEEDMYRLKDDDLFLIPTAEVPLTNLHRDEILDEEQLPITYTAYTPCFRREAGSYGKDTKGLTRVHQFDKIELVRFTTPETSYDEHEQLVRQAETILQRLGLHYRVVALASGDLGFSAAKCYDLEAWAPGLGQYLEVSSCSNFEDFQARRANIRYRQKATKKPAFVHTLNGSGVALARTLICLLETYQQADGRILVPEVLQPYLHGERELQSRPAA
jgi:seryl-tRNA synthetase